MLDKLGSMRMVTTTEVVIHDDGPVPPDAAGHRIEDRGETGEAEYAADLYAGDALPAEVAAPDGVVDGTVDESIEVDNTGWSGAATYESANLSARITQPTAGPGRGGPDMGWPLDPTEIARQAAYLAYAPLEEDNDL